MRFNIDETRARLLFAEGDDPNASGGGGEKKDASAQPTFVPSEDFKIFQQTVLDGMNSMKEALQAL